MKTSFFDFKIVAVPDQEATSIPFEGENRQHALVICQAAGEQGELQDFLGKILGAVNLDIKKDVTLLFITPGADLSLSRLARELPAEKVLVFGISPRRLGLQFEAPPYLPLTLGNTSYLFADDLMEIYKERRAGGRKRAAALWQALQLFFPKSA